VKPTAKQLAYLRTLAARTGQTFQTPSTRADASREIARLRSVPSDSHSVRARELKDLRNALTQAAGAGASVKEHEITGYGSSCHWATGAPAGRAQDSRQPRSRP
jgi:hypothetical protein